MGLLDEVLVRNPPLALYRLRDTLACTRMLANSNICGRETNLAVVYEKDTDFVVFPVCKQHLPSWCKDAQIGNVGGAKDARASSRASSKINSNSAIHKHRKRS